MKPREIKAEIIRLGLSLTEIAREAECSLPEVSMCISGDRIYFRIRKIIAKQLGRDIDEVFADDHPRPKQTSRWYRVS